MHECTLIRALISITHNNEKFRSVLILNYINLESINIESKDPYLKNFCVNISVVIVFHGACGSPAVHQVYFTLCLHRVYTVLTSCSHCVYTAFTPYLHHIYTMFTPTSSLCLGTTVAWPLSLRFIQCLQSAYTVLTPCLHSRLPWRLSLASCPSGLLYTVFTPCLHRVYTIFTPYLHLLYTNFTRNLSIFSLNIAWIQATFSYIQTKSYYDSYRQLKAKVAYK